MNSDQTASSIGAEHDPTASSIGVHEHDPFASSSGVDESRARAAFVREQEMEFQERCDQAALIREVEVAECARELTEKLGRIRNNPRFDVTYLPDYMSDALNGS